MARQKPSPIRVIGKTETSLRLAVKAIFDRFRLKLAAQVLNGTMPEALLQQFVAALKKDMTPILRDEFVRTFTDIQRKTLTGQFFAGTNTPKMLAQRWSESDLPKRTFVPIENVTRDIIQSGITELLRNPKPQDFAATLAQLNPAFSDSRAVRIAVTETTRARTSATKSFQTTLSKLGYGYLTYWTTKVTDVCSICKPLDGTLFVFGEGPYSEGPPVHPNCRCKLLIEEDPKRPDPDKPLPANVPKGPKPPKPLQPPKPSPTNESAKQVLRQVLRIANTEEGRELVEVTRQIRQFSETQKQMTYSRPKTKAGEVIIDDPVYGYVTAKQLAYDKKAKIFNDNYRAAIKERDRLTALLNGRAHDMLKVNDPIEIQVYNMHLLTPNDLRGLDVFQTFMSTDQPLNNFWAGKRPTPLPAGSPKDVFFTVKRLTQPNARAFHREGVIHLTLHEEPKTIVHEIGHLLDKLLDAIVPANDPTKLNVLQAVPEAIEDTIDTKMGLVSRQHMLDRTTAKLTKFKKTFAGTWGSKEQYRAAKDPNFPLIDLYAQKDYVAEYGQAGDTSSEVLSSGCEELFANPVALAVLDPELFVYTVAVLRGQK